MLLSPRAMSTAAAAFLSGALQAHAQSPAEAADQQCANASGAAYVACLSEAMTSKPKSASRDEKLRDLRARESALKAELADLSKEIKDLERVQLANPAKTVRPSFVVKEFGISDVNSAGGVEPYAIFVNHVERSAIKYVRLQVRLYNAVGDEISSSIGAKTAASLRFTGPLASTDGEERAEWEPVWYNATAHCLKIDSVQVTYMDGKTASFAAGTLKAALSPEIPNDCRAKRR